MIEQFINFVIRPPRADYNPDECLWESEFTLAGRKYKRLDLELTNGRGHTLQCSHYVPSSIPENTTLPCVIYCHGNSGCRTDANEAITVLLPSNISVFTLDFSGSGLSGGDYVSLGWHEKDDLKTVVSFLRRNKQVSCIGLWGRSMGAVASLLYGAGDPSVTGMVLDSAFSNLFDLMMEVADLFKLRLPKFVIRMAVKYMRRVIQKRAKFDIMDLNVVQFAPKTSIPALFGHASDDILIHPHHSDLIYEAYAGDKNIIKFEGDHNSPRPQFYYDSVSIFFYNVLRPPQIPSSCSNKFETYYGLGDLKVGAGTNESLLYEINTGLRAVSSDAACSSLLPSGISNGSIAKSVLALLSESIAHMSINNDLDFPDEDNMTTNIGGNSSGESNLQEKRTGPNEESCSYLSSNRESSGRCSSLGDSDRSSSAECTGSSNSKYQMTLRALATPLKRTQRKPSAKLKDNKKDMAVSNKPKWEMPKGETLSQWLRLGMLRRTNHRQHRSI